MSMAERYLSESSVLQAVGDVHPLDYNGQGIVERIKAIPAADVVEVRHGRWNRIDHNALSCNKCGSTFIVLQGYEKMRHCPYCLAKMDGGQD